MKYQLEQEREIIIQSIALQNSAYEFAQWAYPWGKPGTVFEHGLRRWQADELRRISDHTLEQRFRLDNHLPLVVYKSGTSSGRGPGKSAVLGITAHWHMSTHIGAPTIVSANTERQLRDKTFPEYNVWFSAAINSHWFEHDALRISPVQWIAEHVQKKREEGGLGINTKYWYVAGQMWSETNPSAFAGAHNPYGLLLQFDEASGIHSEIWGVSEGFFTEINPFRYWQAMSQMRSRSGRFYDIFYDANHKWPNLRTISTRNIEGVDQGVVADEIRRYGEGSEHVRVEIDGLPPQTSEDQFIPHMNVESAMANSIYPDFGEPLILGVDPAPRGRTSYWFRQGRNARSCAGKQTRGEWMGYDNVQIAEAILDLDAKYKPAAICIDFGMGTGVIDYLMRKYVRGKVHEVKFGSSPTDPDGEFLTHAIELWGALRDWLPGGMIPRDDGSKGTPSFQMLNRGWRWSDKQERKKVLESKEDLMRRGIKSPDDADALACTFEVNPPRIDDKGRWDNSKPVDGAEDFYGDV